MSRTPAGLAVDLAPAAIDPGAQGAGRCRRDPVRDQDPSRGSRDPAGLAVDLAPAAIDPGARAPAVLVEFNWQKWWRRIQRKRRYMFIPYGAASNGNA